MGEQIQQENPPLFSGPAPDKQCPKNARAHDFDCLVVGGGPAGSTAGAYLARAGLRTLIVEKERFPRFHVGESLLPAGNDILRETGVWDEGGSCRVHAANTGPSFTSVSAPKSVKRIRFCDGLIPGNPYTYQVERSRFDELLLRHAEELGCVVRERTRLTAAHPRPDGSGWEATVQTAGGSGPETVRAGWIIDGSGRDQGFSHPLKSSRVDPGGNLPKRAAVYAHFRGVARAPGPAGGNIVIVRHADGWFWLIPLDGERTSVGLVTTLENVRVANGQLAELFQATVARLPKLTALMAGAEPASSFYVTADYTYRAKRFASERLLLIGDAAGFFDPIFSSGIFLGMHSARLAAAAVIHAQSRGGGRALSRRAQAAYTRGVGKAAGVFQRLILAFYDNASYSVFLDNHPPLGLGRAVNSVVAGHTRLPWRVWWRYHAFLLVCRLQRRWSLVPSVPLAATRPPVRAATAGRA